VLALGLAGYANGLYPVEAMKTYESIPGHRERYAPPAVPFPADPNAQTELVEQADAVCIADRFHADPTLRPRIAALFEPGQTFAGSFAIHVRKPGVRAPVQAPLPAAGTAPVPRPPDAPAPGPATAEPAEQ
jgi:hypothetical protein